ncbi:hypothetical protein ACIBRY_17415 [Streptomyces anulatus]
MAADENGAVVPYGFSGIDGQLMDRVQLLSCERAIRDRTDQMADSGVRSVAWPGEQADDQIEFGTDDGGLHLAVRAGPEVPADP